MSRWGILSDIHGDRPALEQALTAFKERGVQRIAVLGDNLGRGDSDGCVNVIRGLSDVSVVGNRDIDWQDRVSAESREYVLSLPRDAIADGLAFSHGDARLSRDLSTGEIRTGFGRAAAWLDAHGCRVWFFGHSHHARIWRLGRAGEPPNLLLDVVRDGLPGSVLLRDDVPDGRWAVNVGSVGLPFPGKGPASAAVYDSDSRALELFAV